jgi:transposase InsO family protein
MVYTFIGEEKANPDCEWSVAEMCRVLEVSRSGFYDWESRLPSERELTDRMLTVEIEAIWECSARTYGSPRVHAWLRRQGFEVSRKRVARIMRAEGFEGESGRRKVRTTIIDRRAKAAEDRVGRDFNPTAPNVTWCGDITYLRTGEGWLYLATVIDLFSRRVIGWSLAEHMRTSLVTDALETAVATRGGHVNGVIFHSDRGCQYTSAEFGELCDRLGVVQSMGATGVCWDKTLASHCTSWCWLDGDSVGEAAAHAFDEPRVAGGGRLEEPLVLVVGLVGDEQAGALPVLDGGDVEVEAFGDLADCEQAARPQPFGVAGEPVCAA